MSTLANQPAFPGVESSEAAADSYGNNYTYLNTYQGMTLRQYYAGLAMQGLVSNIVGIRAAGFKDSEMGEFAVMQADALIAELEKQSDA